MKTQLVTMDALQAAAGIIREPKYMRRREDPQIIR